jgi:two-component system nitrate/nitrite response regulator NarL
MNCPDKIPVVLVDDHAVVREALVASLAREPDIEVEASCGTLGEGLEALRGRPAGVVLLDYTLGMRRGSEFVDLARQQGYEGKILVLTAGLSDAEAVRLMRGGVMGIVMKDKPLSAVLEAVRNVARGMTAFEERHMRALFELAADQGEGELTVREESVLRLVAEGLGNREIAEQVGVTEAAVKATLQRLFAKLGVRTRAKLVGVALERRSRA